MRERSSLLLLLSLSEQKQKLLQVKLVLPAAAALPLLVAYGGGTGVSIPHPLFRLLKNVKFLGFSITSQYLELGWIYKAYMAALVIFCTNAINILAGVNGLEAGQTAVTAAAVAAHNLGSIASLAAAAASPAASAAAAKAAAASADGHLFSLFIMLPLLATSLGLLWHNWYPSDVVWKRGREGEFLEKNQNVLHLFFSSHLSKKKKPSKFSLSFSLFFS